MRNTGKICALALVLLMFCSLVSAAFADNDNTNYLDMSMEKLMLDFLSDYGMPEDRIGMGYKNLATGEEFFINADQYRISASMYKVPLNMVYAERIHDGQMQMDTKIGAFEYSALQYSSIVNSSNEAAARLWENLGDYNKYRRLIAPYLNVDPDNVERIYYENNFSTPRQMLYCIELLYNEPERFPGVIDCMLQAEPEKFYNLTERPYKIAQKYGYVTENERTYLNCCGIIWTDDPIAVVVFTDNFPQRGMILGDYITRIIDWTQARSDERKAEAERIEQERLAEEERIAEEARLAEEAAQAAQAEREASLAASIAALPIIEHASDGLNISFSQNELTLYYIIAGLGLLLLVLLVLMRKKANIVMGLVSIVSLCAALGVCVFGTVHGTIILQAQGNPEDSVTGLFDAVCDGEYDKACEYLYGCSELGIGGEQEDSITARIADELQRSYSWETYGEMNVAGLTADRAVLFTYLDIDSLNADIETRIDPILEELVEEHSIEEVYDEDGNYLPQLTEELYEKAVDAALENVQMHYKTEAVQLRLISKDGSWYIVPNQKLISMLSGGIV